MATGIIGNRPSTFNLQLSTVNFFMLKNYLKTAWRNLLKNKAFSFINAFGLSIGIAFALLVGSYIWSELRVNADLENNDRIYMVQSKWKDPDMGFDFSTLAPL